MYAEHKGESAHMRHSLTNSLMIYVDNVTIGWFASEFKN